MTVYLDGMPDLMSDIMGYSTVFFVETTMTFSAPRVGFMLEAPMVSFTLATPAVHVDFTVPSVTFTLVSPDPDLP